MEEPGDWMKYYSFEFTEALFDELTTFTEEQFDQIDTRVRSTDPVLSQMLYVRAGSNPPRRALIRSTPQPAPRPPIEPSKP